MWNVTINSFGAQETTTVDAETLGEALGMALIELGFEDNDEGTYTVKAEATDE